MLRFYSSPRVIEVTLLSLFSRANLTKWRIAGTRLNSTHCIKQFSINVSISFAFSGDFVWCNTPLASLREMFKIVEGMNIFFIFRSTVCLEVAVFLRSNRKGGRVRS